MPGEGATSKAVGEVCVFYALQHCRWILLQVQWVCFASLLHLLSTGPAILTVNSVDE